jgi:prepilin-type N-terminal cleavage/methylation domain-containing protein/prepilin-type processing-associated H-X9-DG protein
MTTPTERTARRGRPCGFTLLELLLVMAVISILISLLLPAIQSSRELARRLQCSKNLMQVGLALGNYHAAHRSFPPGVVDQAGPVSTRPAGYHWGWQARILPYLEQGNLYHQLNFQVSVYASENDTSRTRRISVYQCPSEASPIATSYAGAHHDVEAPIAADNHGVLFLNSRVRRDDITDGPAFTIVAGEFLQKTYSLGWAVGTRSSLRNTGTPINAAAPFAFNPAAGPGAPGRSDELKALEQRISEGELAATFVGGFSSNHTGGANFLLGDGAVRYISERVRDSVYRSLGHRADGNLISADEY